MSEHGHDEHASHGGHDAHDHGGHAEEKHGHDAHGHDSHGHDDHGHGGHGGGVGDYNTEPPGPSTLPAVPWWGLMVMGAVQFFLLGMIVSTSLALGGAEGGEGHAKNHGEASPEAHGAHTDKKE